MKLLDALQDAKKSGAEPCVKRPIGVMAYRFVQAGVSGCRALNQFGPISIGEPIAKYSPTLEDMEADTWEPTDRKIPAVPDTNAGQSAELDAAGLIDAAIRTVCLKIAGEEITASMDYVNFANSAKLMVETQKLLTKGKCGDDSQ